MDPLEKNYEVSRFEETLIKWCRKAVKTKATIEETYMNYENVDVTRMKEEVCTIIDKAFEWEI